MHIGASRTNGNTQVIQAPLSGPKAICHAGSSDWKYSSGWKKVLVDRAFAIRNASSTPKTRDAGQAEMERPTGSEAVVVGGVPEPAGRSGSAVMME